MKPIRWLTESSVVSMLPFGRSPTRVVSLKLIFTLLAAVDVAAPLCGFVASSKTFKEAIACNCVAFSSTFPKQENARGKRKRKVGQIIFRLILVFVFFPFCRSHRNRFSFWKIGIAYHHALGQWCESSVVKGHVEIWHQLQLLNHGAIHRYYLQRLGTLKQPSMSPIHPAVWPLMSLTNLPHCSASVGLFWVSVNIKVFLLVRLFVERRRI